MFDVIGQQDALINKLQVVIEGQRSLSRQIAEGRPDSGPKLAGTALKRRPATRAGLLLVPGVGGEWRTNASDARNFSAKLQGFSTSLHR
jgi:hypothetical protein